MYMSDLKLFSIIINKCFMLIFFLNKKYGVTRDRAKSSLFCCLAFDIEKLCGIIKR